MKILALEFSSSQRSVAVVAAPRIDNSPEAQTPIRSRVGSSEVIESAPGNTMKPLSMVEEALKQAGLEREQIDCVAVGLGPGSYTGIRVAIALAQGWQLARGVKLLGISSAECIATQAQQDGVTGRVNVVVDAQRNEFYLAGYESGPGGFHEIATLKVVTAAEVHERERMGELLIGPDAPRWFPGGRLVFPRAATLGLLALTRGHFVSGEKLEPIYLREAKFLKGPPPRIIT
jgi:tRNA threonylcarbamoyl adenosine modification protein YeaZ